MAKPEPPQGNTIPPGRIKIKSLHVTIEKIRHEIIHMTIADVLIAGTPDWFAPRQKVDFSFVITLASGERNLPTYGIVVRNDSAGLEVRYTPPSLQWRDVLTKLIQDEMRQG